MKVGDTIRLAGKLWRLTKIDRGIYTLRVLAPGTQWPWADVQYLSAADMFLLNACVEND